MNTPLPITAAAFRKRLVDLCCRSGLADLPKDQIDQHILFKSMLLLVGRNGPLSGQEMDEKLKQWINQIGGIQKLDHASLRRWLIDAGYITRNSDGTCYQVAQPGPHADWFSAEVDELNVVEVIQTGLEEIARRKQAFMQRGK